MGPFDLSIKSSAVRSLFGLSKGHMEAYFAFKHKNTVPSDPYWAQQKTFGAHFTLKQKASENSPIRPILAQKLIGNFDP